MPHPQSWGSGPAATSREDSHTSDNTTPPAPPAPSGTSATPAPSRSRRERPASWFRLPRVAMDRPSSRRRHIDDAVADIHQREAARPREREQMPSILRSSPRDRWAGRTTGKIRVREDCVNSPSVDFNGFIRASKHRRDRIGGATARRASRAIPKNLRPGESTQAQAPPSGPPRRPRAAGPVGLTAPGDRG